MYRFRYADLRPQSICRLRCLQSDSTFLLRQLYQLNSDHAENARWNGGFVELRVMSRIIPIHVGEEAYTGKVTWS